MVLFLKPPPVVVSTENFSSLYIKKSGSRTCPSMRFQIDPNVFKEYLIFREILGNRVSDKTHQMKAGNVPNVMVFG